MASEPQLHLTKAGARSPPRALPGVGTGERSSAEMPDTHPPPGPPREPKRPPRPRPLSPLETHKTKSLHLVSPPAGLSCQACRPPPPNFPVETKHPRSHWHSSPFQKPNLTPDLLDLETFITAHTRERRGPTAEPLQGTPHHPGTRQRGPCGDERLFFRHREGGPSPGTSGQALGG